MPKLRAEDLSGRTYGKLYVIGRGPYEKRKNPVWVCRCECGTETIVQGAHLRSGTTQSCGCMLGNTTHGFCRNHRKIPEYGVWSKMRNRCYNQKSRDYINYGARGITVCGRWQGPTGFANFYADMGRRPSSQHSIDRIDNNGNYEPGNCRWALRKIQNNNKRSNHLITWRGKTQSLMLWSQEIGINYACLKARVNKHNWDIERAFTTPSRGRTILDRQERLAIVLPTFP